MKKQGRGKLSEKQKLSCMIPIRLTPPEHKKFAKIAKESGAKYISQLARDIIVKFLELRALEQKIDDNQKEFGKQTIFVDSDNPFYAKDHLKEGEKPL